jgi:hypothetical protein
MLVVKSAKKRELSYHHQYCVVECKETFYYI